MYVTSSKIANWPSNSKREAFQTQPSLVLQNSKIRKIFVSNHHYSNFRIKLNESKFCILYFYLQFELNQTNWNWINFHQFFEYFLPFWIHRIANFWIKINEFPTNSNLTPPLHTPNLSISSYIGLKPLWMKMQIVWKNQNCFPKVSKRNSLIFLPFKHQNVQKLLNTFRIFYQVKIIFQFCWSQSK